MSSHNFESGNRQRSFLIDFLRGFCLVLMTIDHLPHDPLERLAWQPLGFVSAAEGFVFLSGLVTGLVYGRTAIARGMGELWRRALRRAWVLYVSNFVLVTGAVIAAKEHWANMGDGIQPGWPVWIKAVLCLEAPGYTDILRMYFAFFLLLPVVLWAILNGRSRYVALISIGLWFAASRGYGMVAFPQLGYFDIVSWQLLFVGGLFFGFTPLLQKKEMEVKTRWVVVAFAAAVPFFLLRHWHLFHGQFASPYFQWLSTWRRTLPLARLLDFAALAILIYRFRRRLAALTNTWAGRAISYLGQHSLQVFIWSVFVSMVLARTDDVWNKMSPVKQSLLTILSLISCFIPAWLHQQWKAFQRRGSVPSNQRPPLASAGAVGS